MKSLLYMMITMTIKDIEFTLGPRPIRRNLIEKMVTLQFKGLGLPVPKLTQAVEFFAKSRELLHNAIFEFSRSSAPNNLPVKMHPIPQDPKLKENIRKAKKYKRKAAKKKRKKEKQC